MTIVLPFRRQLFLENCKDGFFKCMELVKNSKRNKVLKMKMNSEDDDDDDVYIVNDINNAFLVCRFSSLLSESIEVQIMNKGQKEFQKEEKNLDFFIKSLLKQFS
jgi:hypothetical protein